jgi:hypothetical protein
MRLSLHVPSLTNTTVTGGDVTTELSSLGVSGGLRYQGKYRVFHNSEKDIVGGKNAESRVLFNTRRSH